MIWLWQLRNKQPGIPFLYFGRKYKVTGVATRGFQPSPFDDGTKSGSNATVENLENGKQLIRSAGSVAANYIEANEALSKKDFIMRIKICRKEAKESRLWLNLTLPKNELNAQRTRLVKEATELMKIFGSILAKTGNTKF